MIRLLFRRPKRSSVPGSAPASDPKRSRPAAASEPWIGVDLDGTLAHHTRLSGPGHIGPPVPAMVLRVRAWLAAGYSVKIFTARANDPACHDLIRAWLEQAGLPPDLGITATKDYDLIEFWDDRAVQVTLNTGRPAPGSISRFEPPKSASGGAARSEGSRLRAP